MKTFAKTTASQYSGMPFRSQGIKAGKPEESGKKTSDVIPNTPAIKPDMQMKENETNKENSAMQIGPGILPQEIHFKTVVEDDGQDLGGGWMNAYLNYKLYYRPFLYYQMQYISMNIGVPKRNYDRGVISREYAQQISALAINSTAPTIRNVAGTPVAPPAMRSGVEQRMSVNIKGTRVTR